MKKIVITGGLGYIGTELCKLYSGESRFKDPVAYMITGSMAVLRLATDLKEQWLYNIYKMELIIKYK